MKVARQFGLVAAMVVVAAGEGVAAVKYFRPAGTTAKWSDNVWYDSEVGGSLVTPAGAADRAVILATKICQVLESNEAADTVVVRTGATLEIHPEWTLTLDNNNNNGAVDSIIDGELHILIDDPEDPNEAGTLAITTENHTFSGDGGVFGDHQNCLVTIAAGTTLTNQLDNDGIFAAGGFVGAMTIRGLPASGLSNGEFRNEGIVLAIGTGIITGDEEFVLEVDTRLSDHDTVDQAIWASASGGTLVFQGGTRSLDGHIIVDCKSNLRFDPGSYVATCGTFSWIAGRWDVEQNATLRYTEFIGSPNPGTDICPGGRCDCLKWEITGVDSGTIKCGG